MPESAGEPSSPEAPLHVVATSAAVGSPYPGLRPFESDEADLFFGREAHTDRLLEILQREHFLAVIGPSGCGKSSLVRAGLLPCLKMGSLGSGSDWRIAIMRPGSQPIRQLARALLASGICAPAGAGTGVSAVMPEDAAMFEAELRRGPRGLRHAAGDAMAAQGDAAAATNLLIVVDQFEEIFTYAEAGADHADESDLFVNLLLDARADFSLRIYVVLTMRTDFLGNCLRFHALPDAINRAQYLTPRLTRAEMESAIEGPAQVSGGAVDSALVAELINATQQNSDELPLLQHALSRMWATAAGRDPERPAVGWDDARAAGGLAGALNQHAESVLKGVLATIGADSAGLVQRLFAAITERRSAEDGGQAVRRPQRLVRIAEACGLGADWRPLVPIVKGFAAPDAGLLQHGSELNGDSVIDLAHEALIRQWTRLSFWVAAEERRRNDYLRWTARAAEHRTEQGGLLEGGALARAIEWLRGDSPADAAGWRPTAAWAARYTPGDAAAAFAQTVAFIEESAAAEQQRRDEQRAAAAREQQIAVERAQAAERAASLARRQLLLVAGFSLLLIVFAVATLFFAVESRQNAARAGDAEGRAQLQQAKAEETARRLDSLLTASSVPAAPPLQPASASPSGARGASAGRPRPALVGGGRATGPVAASPGNPVPVGPQPPPVDGSPSSPTPGGQGLSLAALAAIMPNSTASARSTFLKPIGDAMAEFAINTPLRQAHFLGQVSFESGDLRYLQEAWVPTAAQARYEPPNILATTLGNTEPGDGKRYLGRGIIQIVGRGNYKRFGDLLGLDLLNNPELAARPEVAVRLSGVFWAKNGLNVLADADNISGITRRINGGTNGLEARTRAVARAKSVLLPTPIAVAP